jgi:hypothetical protein
MSSVDTDLIKCTCGETFSKHKSGRCMDVILHRIMYQEVPRLSKPGESCYDGVRDTTLFESDWVFERAGELHLLPAYTSDPRQAFELISRWHELGGIGNININATAISANFRHAAVTTYWSYGSGQLKRGRMEWIPARALAPRMIEFLISSKTDNCRWIDGITASHPG